MNDDLPHTLLMIRPSSFGFNPETAATNTFQRSDTTGIADIQIRVLAEFERMVELLHSYEINVHVFEDDDKQVKPDAIFPNNWISFHPKGEIVLYPMMAINRRFERRMDILEFCRDAFEVSKVINLSGEENSGKFLEGTGSIVFDHFNRIMYGCHSARTNPELVEKLGTELDYRVIMFNARDEKQVPVYHTNVMLSVGRKFAVICLDSIESEKERDILLDSFSETDHKVIAISYAQMQAFAGNIIEVQSSTGESIILMSQTALGSFLPGQLQAMGKFAEVLPIEIGTIEKYGGGGVRCMVAGVHLPKKEIILRT